MSDLPYLTSLQVVYRLLSIVYCLSSIVRCLLSVVFLLHSFLEDVADEVVELLYGGDEDALIG